MQNQLQPLQVKISNFLTPVRLDILSFLAGALTVFGFAPFHFYPAPFITVAILFLIWSTSKSTSARSAWRGYLFGMGMFGVGVSWVYVSIHNFGNMPLPLASVAVFLFVSVLSVFPAGTGWIYGRFFKHDMHWFSFIFCLPAIWVLFEWIRGWILTGFPWLNLGYSQVPSFMSGLAPIAGVYGISVFVAFSSAIIGMIYLQPAKKMIWSGALIAMWLLISLTNNLSWVTIKDEPIKVAMVQGNIPITSKWVRENRKKITADYLRLSKQHSDAALIIWPEAAIPGYLDVARNGFLREVSAHTKETDTDYIVGIIERVREQGSKKIFNSAISVSSDEKDNSIYRKQHLVPFGEFLPFKPILGWLINYLHIPMSDLSHSTDTNNTLVAAGQTIGISICYEDAFGEEVIQALPAASMLVNISEDAWFGDSFAPHQRLQMAQMRALESGRPMIRAANTGPSAVIDHTGKITARSKSFEQIVLAASVQPMQGLTPYGRFGNTPVIIFIMLLILAGWLRIRKDSTNPS